MSVSPTTLFHQNIQFIHGEGSCIYNKDEILENIRLKSNVPATYNDDRKTIIFVSCILTCFFCCVFSAMSMVFVMYLAEFMNNKHNDIWIIMFIAAICLILGSMLYITIYSFISIIRYSETQSLSLYQEMESSKYICLGTFQSYVRSGAYYKITYFFYVKKKKMKGEYFTRSNKTEALMQGDQVFVLYKDRKLNFLL